ncbi:MAG: YifB family Mg chelatase-like AAA ATPase [Candidatus Dependentiae bacterium]
MAFKKQSYLQIKKIVYTTQLYKTLKINSFMHTKIFSASTIGVDAHLIEVEVDLSFGLVNFFIVGLPDTAVKESSKRILTALKNSGIPAPAKKITVNLAPADLKKEGTLFDLPIAIGILQAAEHITIDNQFINETIFLGELSLDGSIRFIKGALAIAYDAHKLGKKRIIVPLANATEASLIKDIEVIGVSHITQLIAYLRKEIFIAPTKTNITHHNDDQDMLDFNQVKGQHIAKRALQIAAAGRHNILFIGPPGAGKTMLAKRLLTIMPAMEFDEILQTSKIYSISGKLNNQPLVTKRPFRAPHHTISQAGLVGGGSYPQPGEISLAHHGILFLDELTEFKRHTLEVLRQPLESRTVNISRAQHSLSFPASFLLVAATNPCPCGYWGDKKKQCVCSAQQIARYLDKLSGPLLDRIDLQISIQSIEYDTIKNPTTSNQSSADLLNGVTKAVGAQLERSKSLQKIIWNAYLPAELIETHCPLTPEAEAAVKKSFEALNLSMRGYHKLIKIARTIADLESHSVIQLPHIQEALMYRSLDSHLERHKL